jgi:hypothetical protein
MKPLEDRVAMLERQMEILVAHMNAKAVSEPPADDTPTVPRGKYAGKKHADVVRINPQHICWLADNGLAYNLGYTDAHIAEARSNV